MEKNNKLLAARDVILAYLMKEELTVDEAREVLHMCRNEIDAGVNRMNIKEVTPHPSVAKDALAEKTAEQSEAKFSAKEEERSLRGEKDNPSVSFGDSSPYTGESSNKSQPKFGRKDGE